MQKDLQNIFKDHTITIVIILTLFLGIFLRFYELTFQSYWFDELFSASVSNPANSLSEVFARTVGDVHPPLYQILLWVWYHIFGYSEWVGRSFSAVMGVLGIVAIYLLGKELYNKEVGLYATIIASTNYFLIYYSQETRAYTLLFLLSIISYLFLIRTLQSYSKLNFILYLFFTISLLYTHYFGFFFVATQAGVFLWYIFMQREEPKHLIILAVITTISFILAILPLVPYILETMQRTSSWMLPPSPSFLIDYFKNYTLSPFIQKIFALLLLIATLHLFLKSEKSTMKKSTLLLFIWIIIGYSLPYIKSIVSVPLLSEKNTMIVLPALILLIAYGVYSLRFYWLKIAIVGMIIFFALYHLYRMHYYDKVTKDEFKTVLLEIEKSQTNLPIYDFIMHGYQNNQYESFYFQTQAMISHLDVKSYTSKTLQDRYNTTQTLPSCFWVVYAHDDYVSKVNLLKVKGLQKVTDITKHHAVGILYAYKTDLKKCLTHK